MTSKEKFEYWATDGRLMGGMEKAFAWGAWQKETSLASIEIETLRAQVADLESKLAEAEKDTQEIIDAAREECARVCDLREYAFDAGMDPRAAMGANHCGAIIRTRIGKPLEKKP